MERDREREGRGLPLEIQGRGVATRVDGATLKVQGSSTCSGRARKKGKVEREREGGGCPWRSRAGVWPPGWMAPHSTLYFIQCF